MKELLYIGLRGLAGCGKDTVGCFLNYILENYNLSKEQCLENFRLYPKKVFAQDYTSDKVFKIAFADQLKKICSMIFGVPIDAFYNGNKANAWVCINQDFEYTEIKPQEKDGVIITALEYAYNDNKNPNTRYWMSIRELMVYVGTYILQQKITPNIFTNIVDNTIKRKMLTNDKLKYAICSDVRFGHELNYIHEKFGVVINIINSRVNTPLDNIAETSLNNSNKYDFTIFNNGTYEDLFCDVYDLVHDNKIFENIIEVPETRSLNTDIFFRKISETSWEICTTNKINRLIKDDGSISLIDPSGGPVIEKSTCISGTCITPKEIVLDDNLKFILKEQ